MKIAAFVLGVSMLAAAGAATVRSDWKQLSDHEAALAAAEESKDPFDVVTMVEHQGKALEFARSSDDKELAAMRLAEFRSLTGSIYYTVLKTEELISAKDYSKLEKAAQIVQQYSDETPSLDFISYSILAVTAMCQGHVPQLKSALDGARRVASHNEAGPDFEALQSDLSKYKDCGRDL
ncbi:hypothetical protein [Herbaspirillum huttiense]|uniref:hypothetical protein n=1 Tax=Herbaspirillum huttiense TaxID=863372 RepID=UPI0039B08F9B